MQGCPVTLTYCLYSCFYRVTIISVSVVSFLTCNLEQRLCNTLFLAVRYESTIVGQFFGHTHEDEFEIFYDDKDPSKAIQ